MTFASFLPVTWFALLGATAISYGQSSLVATYLPHGPADPPNPAWAPTTYRDIPWWFEDTNPYWENNSLPNGAADAYDVSVVYAARLNRNNATGYEAAMINMPGAVGSYYGAPGGAFGSPANSIVWGNTVTWSFSFIYDWSNGNPEAFMTFQNGATTHTASAALGSRVLDFVEGTGPFLIFFDGSGGCRSYLVNGLGCVTRDLFQASRYEIDRFDAELGYMSDGLHTPKGVTIPVCAYSRGEEFGYEFYCGNHRIALDPACGKSTIHQAACGAKKLARPTFCLGGPFGAVVQTKPFDGNCQHVAYFGIDLLFYPQGNARIPDMLEGFTRIGINHFASIPRYW
jgi:hypothetical protein